MYLYTSTFLTVQQFHLSLNRSSRSSNGGKKNRKKNQGRFSEEEHEGSPDVSVETMADRLAEVDV